MEEKENSTKPPKSIISMTFLGTAQNRTKPTLLTGMFETIEKYAAQKDSPVAAKLFDGVGCESTDGHPTPGTYVWDPNTDIKTQDPDILSKQTRGLLLGYGTDHLLLEATMYIEKIIHDNGGVLPETINLQGFSRGADNCLRLANVIYDLFPSIKVNLFLIDQVPGSFRRDDPYSYTIPPNVENFTATIMLNEYTPIFKPQHMKRWVFISPEKTKVRIHTHAGIHGEAIVKNASFDSHASYDLTKDEILQWNKTHGCLPETTQLNHDFIFNENAKSQYIKNAHTPPENHLSSQQRFEKCCEMLQEFKKRHWSSYRLHERTPLLERSEYVETPEVFINQEHRELFKELYPQLFHYFFENNCEPKVSSEQVLNNFTTLKQDKNSNFFVPEFLRYCNWNGTLPLPSPKGPNFSDTQKLGQAQVTDSLSYLQHSLQTSINYYHYHCAQKDQHSNMLVKMIKTALKNAKSAINNDAAEVILKDCINTIKRLPKQGFIANEVEKILTNDKDLESYYKQTIDALRVYLNKELSTTHKEYVQDCINTIQEKNKSSYPPTIQYSNIKTALSTLHNKISGEETIDLIQGDYSSALTKERPFICQHDNHYFLYAHSNDIGWRLLELNPKIMYQVDFTQTKLVPTLKNQDIFKEIRSKTQPYKYINPMLSGIQKLIDNCLSGPDLVDSNIRNIKSHILRSELRSYIDSISNITKTIYNKVYLTFLNNMLSAFKNLKAAGWGNNLEAINALQQDASAHWHIAETGVSSATPKQNKEFKTFFSKKISQSNSPEQKTLNTDYKPNIP
jgi:Domain of unknown function (DUF5621)